MIKKLLRKGCLLLLPALPLCANAQYCTPSNTQGTAYFFSFHFEWPVNNGIVDPQIVNNTNSSYTNNVSAGSMGTYKRYFSMGSHYAIFNPSLTTTYANSEVRSYVDWNNDGDFNDSYENPYIYTFSLAPNTSYNYAQYVSAPINTLPGNYRMRITYSQSGSPSACGSFTGETEDFIITIGNNNAPILNTGVAPFINKLLVSQTDNSGLSIDELLRDSAGNYIVADSDDWGNSRVPRGIAITGQNATNGTWQYRVGNGTWTSFGAVSATNALLLSNSGLVNSDPSVSAQIRFVPSGPGNPSFSFRAWDMTTGTLGSYANTTTNGGTTAYSTAQQTATVNVIASVGTTPANIYIIATDTAMRTSIYDHSSGTMVHPDKLSTSTAQQIGADLRMDPSDNKLYWSDYNNIYRAAADGTNQAQLVTGLAFNSGIAAGGGYLFYNDNSTAVELYRSSTSGTGAVSLLDGAGQIASADLGYLDKMYYYNNRLYMLAYAADYSTYILSVAADGTGADTVQATASAPYGLHVVSDTAFWTESDGSTSYIMRKAANGTGTATTIASSTSYLFGSILADPGNNRVLVIAGNQLLEVSMSGVINRVMTMDGSPAALAGNMPDGTPLPIAITSWDAAAEKNIVNLTWNVAGEERGTIYQIERSADGRSFQALTQKPGTNERSYRAYDREPLVGANYYRLVSIGQSGKRSLSGIRKVVFGMAPSICIVPNPAGAEGWTVNVSGDAAFPQSYRILDVTGNIVKSGVMTGPKTSISTGDLAPGQYLMQALDQSFILVRR